MSVKHQCETCQMKFNTKSNLQRHISNIHLKEKNFKCEHCEFICNVKSNLKKHSCYIKKVNPISDPDSSQYSIEYGIQRRLEQELNGNKISCPFGRVDLMTSDTIIEIKKWDEHKKAIGQIMGYSVYFPIYKKRIHFFGSKPTTTMEKAIRDVCQKFNIEITEEPDNDDIETSDI